MAKTVFLDRDGVINRPAGAHDYVKTWQEFQFLPGAPPAIRQLNEAGYQMIIVTNQRGIARGLMTMEALNEIHTRMCVELLKQGAYIDAIFVCPHENGQCDCRKPKIGLFLQAEQFFKINKMESWMVGDSMSDIQAGMNYGVQTLLISDGCYSGHVRKNLAEAADFIIESELT